MSGQNEICTENPDEPGICFDERFGTSKSFSLTVVQKNDPLLSIPVRIVQKIFLTQTSSLELSSPISIEEKIVC